MCPDGEAQVGLQKQEIIEKVIAFHLGNIKGIFNRKAPDGDLISTADETHSIFNMEEGRTIRLRGVQHIKYTDVVAEVEGVTMVIHVSGGRSLKVECPMIISQNSDRSYTKQGVTDNVPGVCNRSQLKGWMDTATFVARLSEKRVNKVEQFLQKRTFFVDSCSGHSSTPEAIRAVNAFNVDLCKLPQKRHRLGTTG